MSYFIAQLCEAINAKVASVKTDSLCDKINEWYNTLPAIEKKRQWSLEELSVRFKRPQQTVAHALHSLGWKRQRRWNTDGPYVRLWMGPV